MYTPYRTALPDPTVLPLEADITWNTFLGGIKDTAFVVTEDYQQPVVANLGWSNREWHTSFSIYVMTIWTNEGKPPYLKEFSTFLEKYLIIKGGLPDSLRTAGLTSFMPTQFQLAQGLTTFRGIGGIAGIQNPETDWWILAVNVHTKYFEAANVSP